MLFGSASDISQQVLRTDVAGMPLEWIDYREAVRLYHTEQVAYAVGTRLYTVHGGFSALTGRRSVIDVNSIIATHGTSRGLAFVRDQYVPPLNNRTAILVDRGENCGSKDPPRRPLGAMHHTSTGYCPRGPSG